MCVLVQFLSSGKGVRLGLVVEGGGRVPGSCVEHQSLPDRLERGRPDQQVVSTRGVAVSITGCRLRTRLSQIFF